TYTAGNQFKSVKTREGATAFAYVDGRLSSVSGTWGSETYAYDREGNAVKHSREIGGREFTTEYRYAANGRVKQRQLPSGEWLTHEYNENGSLRRIARNQLFRQRTLIGQPAEKSSGLDPLGEIAFGNGIELSTRFDAQGRLRNRSVDGLGENLYEYDEAARLIRINADQTTKSYKYDAANRLIAARSPRGELRYNYDANGNRLRASRKPPVVEAASEDYRYGLDSNRLLSIEGESSVAVRYDASGNPEQLGERRYEYNSAGRPTKLFINNDLIAEYGYNLWGERVSKTVHSHRTRTTTFFIYEQHRLVAEADERGRITREYVYLDHHPVAMLDNGVPYWIHTNHLGAPQAITNEARIVVWRAEYEPFGLAEVHDDPDGDGRKLSLNLRLPGQYADEESGTYYNIMRDYDPETGRYLTPDPLGVFDGANTFAYVGGDPLSAFDALGLYLFAFDGTWIDRSRGTLTNVELFRQYYDPTFNEANSFYRRGIGTGDPNDSDLANSVDRVLGGAFGFGGENLIRDALRRLDELVANSGVGNNFDGVIDIVGFSRGAAVARAFANEVYGRIDKGHYRQPLESSNTCRSLRIRFMGLFDTVGAFGLPGNSIDLGYDFRINDRIGTVAHAIALNEHRAAFDLVSIQASEHGVNTTPYREERGFIGAHSDIGGGYSIGDLSDVALRWMHTKAMAAGVRMLPMETEHMTVRAPIVHDERTFSQDREIFYPNDPNWNPATCDDGPIHCLFWRPPLTQRQLTAPQFQHPELRDFIIEDPQPGSIRGTVDVERYRSWLRSRGQL
ncbi:MAG: phospholipase effector Tle1 domain-containing protein, partial [Steroidobacter sp.]